VMNPDGTISSEMWKRAICGSSRPASPIRSRASGPMEPNFSWFSTRDHFPKRLCPLERSALHREHGRYRAGLSRNICNRAVHGCFADQWLRRVPSEMLKAPPEYRQGDRAQDSCRKTGSHLVATSFSTAVYAWISVQ
jgi:hypothetical protein